MPRALAVVRWAAPLAFALALVFPASVFADAPTADDKPSEATLEGTPVTITMSGGDTEGAALTFNIGTGPTNGSLSNFGTPLCDGNTPSSCTETVDYTPNADFSGSDSFTYTTNDGSVDSLAATVSITVNFVNDAPSFSKGADQTINEDAGAQSVPGWATSISPGPSNESSQTVHFNITNVGTPGLFSVAPAVAADGTLSYTPAADTSGSSTVTLDIQDNGGTANGGVDTSATQQFTITVNFVNDAPSFSKGADQTINEDAGAQSVPGWATSISPGPSNESSQTVHFNITNVGTPGLFSVAPAVAADGTLSYTPAADTSGSSTVTLDIQDNGGTANGGVDTSATQQFTITVNFVNDAPSFSKGADQTINEDAGAQSVPGWATSISPGPSNESSQTVHFNITNVGTPGLFSVAPAVAADGTLSYTPAADTSGSSTVTLDIQDNGGTANGGVDTSATQQFTITVNFVNDAPSFSKGADQTINEDAGAQSVPGWATSISPGPSNESSQTVHFNITNVGTPGLFSVAPAVAADGTLSYTPAADTSGSSTVTLDIQDNGGTANGGVDTSATQQFTITVNFVNDAPSFSKGADQTINEDAGAQSVPGWATSISPGPSNDSSQTVHFNITNVGTPGLFSVAPAVA